MMECVLKDLIAVSKDGEWGKGEPFDDSVEMLAIRGTDFEDVRFGFTASTPRRHIAKRHAERKLLRPWDVVIEAAGGTKNQITGRTVLLRPQLFSRSELPFTCASFSRFIRFNTELCDPAFMFWYLQHLYASGLMHAYHTQHTGVARFQWTTFSEREPLSLPPLPVQRRIAGILSAYDELMENSQRRIRLLEAMARALYREWFVHFRFPGHAKHPRVASPLGDIPQGWEVKPLFELTKVNYGKNLPTKKLADDGAHPVYGAAKIIGRYTEYTRERRTIICGCRGSVGEMQITEPQCYVTNNSFTFDPTHSDNFFWLFHTLKERGLRDVVGGAAQPQITLEGISSVELVTPPLPLRTRFQQTVSAMFEQAWALDNQIQNLRRTRDLLLPRLLSGQVELKEK